MNDHPPPKGTTVTIALDARDAWIAAWFLFTGSSNPEAHRVASILREHATP